MLCLRLPIGWRLRLSDQLLLMAHSDSEVPETLGRCPWVTGPAARPPRLLRPLTNWRLRRKKLFGLARW